MWKASNLSSTALSRGCHQCLFRAAWGLRFKKKNAAKMFRESQGGHGFGAPNSPRSNWLLLDQRRDGGKVGVVFFLERVYCDT